MQRYDPNITIDDESDSELNNCTVSHSLCVSHGMLSVSLLTFLLRTRFHSTLLTSVLLSYTTTLHSVVADRRAAATGLATFLCT